MTRHDRRWRGAILKHRRKRLLALVVGGVGCLAAPAAAQDTRWDALLSNSNWYVPVPGLIAYTSNNSSLSITPIPIGDQTTWALGTASRGVFSGLSEASFAIGQTATTPALSSMQGIVTEAGQIRIAFTSSGNPTVIGIGQMREISGVPLMEMQMITGTSLLITHWAYMTPYNPAVFTPPSATQYVVANIASPQWNWTAGTTWRVASQTLFGTATPGTFKITNYSNGYYWGVGAAPQDSTVGNFTVLGSMTPEGNALFSLLSGGDTISSLSGQITGDATTGMMVLRPYIVSGFTGTPTLADIMPVSAIAAGQTSFLSNVGSTVIPAFTGGTLQVDTRGGIYGQNFVVDGSASNRLDQRGNSARLTGVLSNAVPGTPGNLTIANSGTGGSITFAGASTYTGRTTIEAGATLSVDGSIVSPVSVAGTLGGTGTVGSTTIDSGGTLAPGNSIGTLTVQGNTSFATGATYAVEVSPTTADRTNVTGTAALGGTLQAIFEAGTYTPRRHTVLSAAGGRTGTFATLSTVDLPVNFAASLDYTATDALLNLSAALGSGTALSPNQSNVAAVINTGFNAANSLPAGLQSLYALSGPPLADALNSLSGEAQSGAQLASFAWGSQFLGTILTSAGGGGLGPRTPTQYVSLAPGAGTEEPGRLRTWITGFGGIGSLGGGHGSSGARTSTQGMAVGGDWSFENTTLGIAVAGGRSTWSLDGGLGSGGGDVFQGAVYGRTGSGPWYAAAVGAWGYHALKTQRQVPFLADQLSSSHSANSWSGRAETGLRLAVGQIGVTPFVAAQAQLLNLPGFCETSRLGNGAALCFNANSPSSVRSELGVEGDVDLGAMLGGQSRLRVRVAWAHEYQATGRVRAAFQALPGSEFTVSGAPLPRDMAIIRVVSDTVLDRTWSFRLQAAAELASQYASFAGTAQLVARW